MLKQSLLFYKKGVLKYIAKFHMKIHRKTFMLDSPS